MEMGHGDEIVIADGNFPSASNARRIVRADGQEVPPILESVLQVLPLDTYVDHPVTLMDVVPGDTVIPVIWDEFRRIIAVHDSKAKISKIGRFEFYERAKNAYAIVATSEVALYANIILCKGVVV